MSELDLDVCVKHPEIAPGETLCHDDFIEGIFVIRGTPIDTVNNKTYKAGYYACRPPGMKHGPFFHPTGAVSLEIRICVQK